MARLFSHYPSPQAGNTLTVAQDWLEDVGEVSAAGFRQAVREWRRGPNAFRPSPGQLLSIVARIEAPLRDRLAYAEDLLEREERMSVHDRIAQLQQRQYEVDELGMTPHEIHTQGLEAAARWRSAESIFLKHEIEQLEQET